MNIKKKLWRWAKNKYVIAGAVAALIIIVILVRRAGGAAGFETATVERGNVVETVGITGAISPLGKADLAFEKSGVLSRLYVKVGDQVTAGQLLASLESAGDQANLAAAEASFNDVARGLRPEEETAEAAKLAAARSGLETAQADALAAARSAYTQTTNAVYNYTDSFFTNPRSGAPVLRIEADSYSIQNNLEQERYRITLLLSTWTDYLNQANSASTLATIQTSLTNLVSVRSFVNNLAALINRSSSSGSASNISTVNSALALLDQAENSLTAAQTSLQAASTNASQAEANYNLRLSGNSPEAIAGQAAKVAAARAELAKDFLRAPLAGVVSRLDPAVGEFVTAGKIAFGVISNDTYKIEAFVPEADIAKVAVGNLASSTLDAYGQGVDFPAQVMTVDPAETSLEGVPTYKVTLYFLNKDERIRSGMTANLEILTHERNDVLVIPYRAVITEDNKKSVRLVKPDGKTYESVPVTTGLRGSAGTIEIVSGLKAGDRVVTYVKA